MLAWLTPCAADAVVTMPPERLRVAGAQAIGEFFATVPQQGRPDEILLLQTATNRQPALAAYARHHDTHRPHGAIVLRIEPLISTIFSFPDPWLFTVRPPA
jgi:RNA polymerase sigma-70 factor (ECF subfamily)